MRPTLLIGFMALAGCGMFGGSDNTGPDAALDCSTVANADTYVVGLDKAGASGILDFKLMSADPAPPARGDNNWLLQISSMSAGVVGSPVSGATMTVTPYMPAHGHGTPIPVVVTPMGDTGEYTLDPVNLWMPGVWETTIVATTPSGTDSAMYRFCLPG